MFESLTFLLFSHNEGIYLDNLLKKLASFIRENISSVKYDIVLIDDYSTDTFTKDIIEKAITSYPFCFVYYHHLERNFSSHKNYGKAAVNSQYLLQLDADEIVTDAFLDNLPTIINDNFETEVFALPRINTVDGLTLDYLRECNWVITKDEQHRKCKVLDSTSAEYQLLQQFGHVISEEENVVTYYEPIVAYPDYQTRLMKNLPSIQWKNSVHEVVTGYQTYIVIPPQHTDLAIRHYKDIIRQKQQNTFYKELV